MADDLQTLPENWQARWVRRCALGLAVLLFVGWVAQVRGLGPFAAPPDRPEPLADAEETCRQALLASFPGDGAAPVEDIGEWSDSLLRSGDPGASILMSPPFLTWEVDGRQVLGTGSCIFTVENDHRTELVDWTWRTTPASAAD